MHGLNKKKVNSKFTIILQLLFWQHKTLIFVLRSKKRIVAYHLYTVQLKINEIPQFTVICFSSQNRFSWKKPLNITSKKLFTVYHPDAVLLLNVSLVILESCFSLFQLFTWITKRKLIKVKTNKTHVKFCFHIHLVGSFS